MRRPMSIPERRLVAALLRAGGAVDPDLRRLSVGGVVVLLRRFLRMTQAVLAERAGMPQSYIARVESGDVQPSLPTVQKILSAMHCDVALVPIPREPLDGVVDRRAMRVAEKRVRYVAGTMALEDQLPEDEILQQMTQEEKERLEFNWSTEIWNDEL